MKMPFAYLAMVITSRFLLQPCDANKAFLQPYPTPAFLSELDPMARPGVSGALPEVLMMDATTPQPDGISPQAAGGFLEQMPLADRRTRGAHEVAIYKALAPSVVLVATDKGFGSGSMIAGGYILTNWHVAGEFSEVGIIFKPDSTGPQPPSPKLVTARVVRLDRGHDLALLKPDLIPAGRRPIELGDRSDLVVGADVHAIGHPSGEVWSYTKGMISQLRDGYGWTIEPRLSFKADVIQTQTPISPGSAGGPLLSDDGKLLGVNAFTDTTAQAINFAVSVVEVRRFLAELNSDAGSAKAANQCRGTVLFEGRDANNAGFIRSVSLKCSKTADLIIFLPDDKTQPMIAYYDSKGRQKADGLILDDSRTGKWQYSYWDVYFDDTFALRGFHANGEIVPTSYERRCPGKAAPNLKCL
jgi:S1-C subfamily serine protease